MNTNISDLPVKQISDRTANGTNSKNASKRCLDINEFLNSAIMIADEMIREKGLVATGFQVIEPGGLYYLSFDPGENFRDFLENILLICRARDLDFGLLIVPSVDPNKIPAGKLTDDEWGRRMIQVALVVEDRHGQRIEKVLPVLRDAAGKFAGFGEYSTAFPDPIGRQYPRFMPDHRPTRLERGAARAALMARGIILNHHELDAANKRAAKNQN